MRKIRGPSSLISSRINPMGKRGKLEMVDACYCRSGPQEGVGQRRADLRRSVLLLSAIGLACAAPDRPFVMLDVQSTVHKAEAADALRWRLPEGTSASSTSDEAPVRPGRSDRR